MDLNSRLVTMQMEIPELYEIFLHEIKKKVADGNNKKIAESVIKGIKHLFNMEDLIKERFIEKTYSKQRNGREVGDPIKKIKISGMEILKIDFEDELYLRVRIMRSWMWENMSTETLGSLRAVGGNDGNVE